MAIYHTIKKTGRFAAVCLVFTMLMANYATAEYYNETLTDPNDPAYWLDQGGLFATYGAYTAAIAAYKKALELTADSSDAYFNMGVAYGELGDYDQALAAINKAIGLDAENDRYYYGRARVRLLEGNRIDAMDDFEKAAGMGNLDAIEFLKR